MMRYLWLALCLVAGAAGAQDFRIGDYRQHRSAAVTAVNGGDFATAETEVAAARAMLPSSPSVLLLGAQVELAAGKPDLARAWLDDYLQRGLWFDPVRYPALVGVLDEAGRARLAENGSDSGQFEAIFQTEQQKLVEGVAIEDGRLVVTTVHDGGMWRAGEHGLEILHDLPDGLGAYGLAVRDHKAWVAVSPGSISGQGGGKVEILQIDTGDGVVTGRFGDSRADRFFGDLALGRRDLYVSDSLHGEVLRLKGMRGPFDVLVPGGQMGSPQGLVEAPDGQVLVVADYSSGLWRVDLGTGEARLLTVPDDASLAGIDGLTANGNYLVAVQNGVKPGRILRIRLDDGWNEITSVEVLVRSQAGENFTSGVIDGGRYVFVARSQWSDFDDDGKAIGQGPAVIGEIPLP